MRSLVSSWFYVNSCLALANSHTIHLQYPTKSVHVVWHPVQGSLRVAFSYAAAIHKHCTSGVVRIAFAHRNNAQSRLPALCVGHLTHQRRDVCHTRPRRSKPASAAKTLVRCVKCCRIQMGCCATRRTEQCPLVDSRCLQPRYSCYKPSSVERRQAIVLQDSLGIFFHLFFSCSQARTSGQRDGQ